VVFLARHYSNSGRGAHPYPECSPARSPPIHEKSTGYDHPKPKLGPISSVRPHSFLLTSGFFSIIIF
jgi:hypothetical protein